LYDWCFFFFQAEDGIRDFHVTGVQTCALPISGAKVGAMVGSIGMVEFCFSAAILSLVLVFFNLIPIPPLDGSHVMRVVTGMSYRSEERRVGKEGRLRWAPHDWHKRKDRIDAWR